MTKLKDIINHPTANPPEQELHNPEEAAKYWQILEFTYISARQNYERITKKQQNIQPWDNPEFQIASMKNYEKK